MGRLWATSGDSSQEHLCASVQAIQLLEKLSSGKEDPRRECVRLGTYIIQLPSHLGTANREL